MASDYISDGTYDTFNDPLTGSSTNGFDFSNLLGKTTDVLSAWAKQSLERQQLRDNNNLPVQPAGEPAGPNWKKLLLWGGVAAGVLLLLVLLFRR